MAPIKSGPMNDVTFPVNANSPNMRDAILRRETDQ